MLPRNLYHAGTAFYTYPECELIDFVPPTKITTVNATTYSSVMVSIKSRLYLRPGDATRICTELKQKADDCEMTGLRPTFYYNHTEDMEYGK
jgi:hypothetical protein